MRAAPGCVYYSVLCAGAAGGAVSTAPARLWQAASLACKPAVKCFEYSVGEGRTASCGRWGCPAGRKAGHGVVQRALVACLPGLAKKNGDPSGSPLSKVLSVIFLPGCLPADQQASAYVCGSRLDREVAMGAPVGLPASRSDYPSRSKRSRVITLVHAATKSCTNCSCASSVA